MGKSLVDVIYRILMMAGTEKIFGSLLPRVKLPNYLQGLTQSPQLGSFICFY